MFIQCAAPYNSTNRKLQSTEAQLIGLLAALGAVVSGSLPSLG